MRSAGQGYVPFEVGSWCRGLARFDGTDQTSFQRKKLRKLLRVDSVKVTRRSHPLDDCLGPGNTGQVVAELKVVTSNKLCEPIL